MGNERSPQKLSLVRLLIVLVSLVLLIFVGAQYVSAIVADLRTGMTSTWFAPYVDVTLPPLMHFEDEAELISDKVVLGFVVADPLEPCQPSWGAYYTLDAAARALDLDRRIVRLQERGGEAVVSFGGAINSELAVVCDDVDALAAAYQSVIDRYDLGTVEFDIEGAATGNRGANRRRIGAIQQLQGENENLDIWLALPVAPHGLSPASVAMVNDYLQNGIELAGVNLLTMNYAGARVSSMPMPEATSAALIAAKAQLADAYREAGRNKTERELWQLLGATPMIGQNDVLEDVFTTDDAQELIGFARYQNLGRLSFWSINRDVPCGPDADRERVSNTCSGVEQEPQQFMHIFAEGVRPRIPFSDSIARIGGPAEAATTEERAQTGEPFTRDDPRTSPYPLWRSERAYEKGAKVVWQGRVYQAKWWSEGDQPDAPVKNVWDTPWRYLGPVLESDREAVRQAPVLSGNWSRWSAERVFLQGDEVEYNNQVYRAKWWSQGDIPEEYPDQPYDHPWEYLGEIDCTDGSCKGDEKVATLVIDYGRLSGIGFEIREDDNDEGTAGRLVQAYGNQNGQKTYEVLQGTYDLVFRMAAAEMTVDSVACGTDRCDTVEIVTTLSINYDGLRDVRTEIRLDDGISGTAGDLVQVYNGQSGQRSYNVLRGRYDVVFTVGTSELIIDSVACESDGCEVGAIGATLAVDYNRMTNVRLEVRQDDGIEGTVGDMVQAQPSETGHKSYQVLRGRYDLMFVKGGSEYLIDGLDCGGEVCNGGKVIEVTFGRH